MTVARAFDARVTLLVAVPRIFRRTPRCTRRDSRVRRRRQSGLGRGGAAHGAQRGRRPHRQARRGSPPAAASHVRSQRWQLAHDSPIRCCCCATSRGRHRRRSRPRWTWPRMAHSRARSCRTAGSSRWAAMRRSTCCTASARSATKPCAWNGQSGSRRCPRVPRRLRTVRSSRRDPERTLSPLIAQSQLRRPGARSGHGGGRGDVLTGEPLGPADRMPSTAMWCSSMTWSPREPPAAPPLRSPAALDQCEQLVRIDRLAGDAQMRIAAHFAHRRRGVPRHEDRAGIAAQCSARRGDHFRARAAPSRW